MQITHEEARKLIQFNADEALDSQEKAMLSAHLKGCSECRFYEADIKEMESILLPIMKRQWNLQPVPLSTHVLAAKKVPKMQAGIILATRTAIIGIVFVSFIFSIWQFTLSGTQTPGQLPVGVLPAPTPSTQSTSTKITLKNCEQIVYLVQENDTLESIAHHFSTPKDEIMAANNLKTEMINTSMELTIPVCSFTPTSTINPATLTTTYTYTPVRDLITSTPDG